MHWTVCDVASLCMCSCIALLSWCGRARQPRRRRPPYRYCIIFCTTVLGGPARHAGVRSCATPDGVASGVSSPSSGRVTDRRHVRHAGRAGRARPTRFSLGQVRLEWRHATACVGGHRARSSRAFETVYVVTWRVPASLWAPHPLPPMSSHACQGGRECDTAFFNGPPIMVCILFGVELPRKRVIGGSQ